MALINCPECKKEISDKVKSCPQCGYPLVSESINGNTQKVEVTGTKINSEKIKPITEFLKTCLSLFKELKDIFFGKKS
jgi:ssDNA-binding Zn-finger/Zn-ribbon topoisomerase 1